MVDVWSDDVGQPDGHGRMVYRLSVGWTDSATALRVDRQTVGAVGMTDGLVA